MKTPAPSPAELTPEQLCHRCDPASLPFQTTDELEDLPHVLGQPRALGALEFGIGMRREGYNLFAMGPAGSGKHTILRRHLDHCAASGTVPPDWCYVHNFDRAHQPRALQLPAGRGQQLQKDMVRLVEDLRGAIPAAFETDEYRARVQDIEQDLEEQQEKLFADFRARAATRNIALVRTPGGLALAPLKEGQAIAPEAFKSLPEEERHRIQSDIAEFQEELERILHQLPKIRRAIQHKIRELNRSVTKTAVNSLIDELKKVYETLAEVVDYLRQVQEDVIENADHFRQPKEGEQPTLFGIPLPAPEAAAAALRRYQVNLLIDHGGGHGAPVVYEDHPTYQNLVGRIEHLSQMGALVTDFTLIKPGALHRANGGYLILDALKLLSQPYAYEGLKRALRAGEIRSESLGQMLSLISTVGLEPQPIPLDLKVVLIGERLLYYLLAQYDPEFNEIFKVSLDFDEDMDRGPEGNESYARLLATLARSEKLRALDRSAVARVIEQSSRLAGDTAKLSLQMRAVVDLLRESDYWAARHGQALITRESVQQAIDAQIHRADRLRHRLQEQVRRGTIFIDTEGARVGQVNGLSVLQLGTFAFGHPSRITARVRLGDGKVVDIEREVELGGPIHSKGVLILSGYLAGTYVPALPLSLSASLVFEQNYGGVEGDSASSAELYALLSALAEVPIRQEFAVTGSVNQRGEVQPIGGVNEKVEGFFDLCQARGLTGSQGVLIPHSNVKHLMLRQDVVEAVAQGRFHLHAVRTIDEGLALLTGMPAGARDGAGTFPKGSVNERVEARLTEFARRAREFRSRPRKGKSA